MWFYWSKARTQQLKTADLSRGESVRVTARAASAHAMLQKMVGSRHYAVRVPIPLRFWHRNSVMCTCVHVYACLSLYVRGPLSCTALCGFRALTYAR